MARAQIHNNMTLRESTQQFIERYAHLIGRRDTGDNGTAAARAFRMECPETHFVMHVFVDFAAATITHEHTDKDGRTITHTRHYSPRHTQWRWVSQMFCANIHNIRVRARRAAQKAKAT